MKNSTGNGHLLMVFENANDKSRTIILEDISGRSFNKNNSLEVTDKVVLQDSKGRAAKLLTMGMGKRRCKTKGRGIGRL